MIYHCAQAPVSLRIMRLDENIQRHNKSTPPTLSRRVNITFRLIVLSNSSETMTTDLSWPLNLHLQLYRMMWNVMKGEF